MHKDFHLAVEEVHQLAGSKEGQWYFDVWVNYYDTHKTIEKTITFSATGVAPKFGTPIESVDSKIEELTPPYYVVKSDEGIVHLISLTIKLKRNGVGDQRHRLRN